MVRRIFVRESVKIPPDCSANVPVRLPFVNMHTPQSNWLTESSEVRPGLLAARTLLSDNDEFAAICLLNVSGVEQSLRGGYALGVASPCDTDDPTTDETDRPTDGSNSDDGLVDVIQTADDSGHLHSQRGHCSESVKVCVVGDNEGDFSHVKPVIDRLPDTLTNDQRQQAEALIKRNADIFSKSRV